MSAPSVAGGNYGPVEVIAGRNYQLSASKVGCLTTNASTLYVPDTNAISTADVKVTQVLPLVSVEAKDLAPGLISSHGFKVLRAGGVIAGSSKT